MKGIVARYGDAEFTAAIADGMAAAKLERELNALKIKEAKWAVRDERNRKEFAQKIEDAELYYGRTRSLPLIPNLLLGFYGLIVWTIHMTYERLKAANRAA